MCYNIATGSSGRIGRACKSGDGSLYEGGVGDDMVEYLGRIKICGIVGVYYQPSIWNHDTEELFHKELRNISRSAVLVFMGDLNFLDLN